MKTELDSDRARLIKEAFDSYNGDHDWASGPLMLDLPEKGGALVFSKADIHETAYVTTTSVITCEGITVFSDTITQPVVKTLIA